MNLYQLMQSEEDRQLARSERERLRARENALNQIFAESYEPGQTVEMYGPTQTGEALAPVQGPGQMNIRNALNMMYQRGFAPEAIKLEQEMTDRELRSKQLGQRPSAVQVYEYWKNLNSPQEQEAMLRTMRGAQFGRIGEVQHEMPSLPGAPARPLSSIEQEVGGQSAVAGGKARAIEIGKETGTQEITLGDMQANLPRLEVVVGQLSDLGKKATYTRAGQAYDIFRRELGMEPREASIARKEYISKVDNEILPLLRITFGSQFTQKEGESLKATLGDPNVSPAEKDAVLRSFIDSKREQVETQKRKFGPKPGAQVGPKPGTQEGGYIFIGGNPADQNNWKKVK